MDMLPGLAADPDDVVAEAREQFSPVRSFCLFSGGHDSTVLAHRCRAHYDELAFIDTGTARRIPACRWGERPPAEYPIYGPPETCRVCGGSGTGTGDDFYEGICQTCDGEGEVSPIVGYRKVSGQEPTGPMCSDCQLRLDALDGDDEPTACAA